MNFIIEGDEPGRPTILLAHGAGAPMDTDFMNRVAATMAQSGFRVVRFEFAYMAARRETGKKAPPLRAERLVAEFREAIKAISRDGILIIGGKSMGGRVASLVADEMREAGDIDGLVCLGYPFHPVGRPDKLRTEHLESIRTPTLICQGTRDSFGAREEVETYNLSDEISIFWLEDGDHDLRPRKRNTGKTQDEYLELVGAEIAKWAKSVMRPLVD